MGSTGTVYYLCGLTLPYFSIKDICEEETGKVKGSLGRFGIVRNQQLHPAPGAGRFWSLAWGHCWNECGNNAFFFLLFFFFASSHRPNTVLGRHFPRRKWSCVRKKDWMTSDQRNDKFLLLLNLLTS